MIKKIAILCTILLTLGSAAFAEDWIRLNITNSAKYIYLDHDSISKTDDSLFYVIKYRDNKNDDKIVYLRYSISQDKIGVIKIKNYDPQKYSSPQVWSETYAFMKKVNDDSLFKNINSFVKDDKMVKELAATRQLRHQTAATNHSETIKKTQEKYPGMQDYITSIQAQIRKNWKLPVTNNGGVAKVQFKINRDGKLVSCEIKQSSGSKTNDASALAAVKNIEAFDKFPDSASKDLKEINILMTFDYYVLDVNKK